MMTESRAVTSYNSERAVLSLDATLRAVLALESVMRAVLLVATMLGAALSLDIQH